MEHLTFLKIHDARFLTRNEVVLININKFYQRTIIIIITITFAALGGASAAVSAGCNESQIKNMGRGASDAYKVYIQK